jgi:hypothetical protein
MVRGGEWRSGSRDGHDTFSSLRKGNGETERDGNRETVGRVFEYEYRFTEYEYRFTEYEYRFTE